MSAIDVPLAWRKRTDCEWDGWVLVGRDGAPLAWIRRYGERYGTQTEGGAMGRVYDTLDDALGSIAVCGKP